MKVSDISDALESSTSRRHQNCKGDGDKRISCRKLLRLDDGRSHLYCGYGRRESSCRRNIMRQYFSDVGFRIWMMISEEDADSV